MKIADLTGILESYAPLSFQEDYDNAGLIVGNPETEINKALICLDVTEDVLEEAVQKKAGLIISHHPLIFKGIRKLNNKNITDRILINAIRQNIAIYAVHTNIDNVASGVNGMIAEKLGLSGIRVLEAKEGLFRKLVTFCPVNRAEDVRNALFNAGAGHIGNYDSCSFYTEGIGTFKGNENTNPYVGEKHKLHYEPEYRIETVYPVHKEREVLTALFSSHPYEEVAYDIFHLENNYQGLGAGLIGELATPMNEIDFLEKLKILFNLKVIRHTKLLNKPVKRVALCGGAGSFLINKAKAGGADIFITGDVKYHDFFQAEGRIVIADIGHYESEQFTKELIHSILIEKIPNFALQISGLNTNPINYF